MARSGARRVHGAAGALALALAAAARGAQEPVPLAPPLESTPIPIAPALPEIVPAYRSFEEMAALVGELARAAPAAARSFVLWESSGGRPVPALEFGRPGASARESRPTVLLIGGLDGVSLSGCEAVLAIARELLVDPERLPEGVAFVAVPWGSPAALSRTLEGSLRDGRNDRALDEDRDGRLDEDGPDDVDGDGLVLSMLVEEAHGPWVLCRDARFLAPAGAGDAPRYELLPEGRDEDGDGRFNEDPAGGVVLDRNFPLGREGAWRDPLCGSLPLSESGSRALADLALSRRTALVLLFQGHHGGIASPGGASGPGGTALPLLADRHLFERATESFQAHTGRKQPRPWTLAEARGGEIPGAALDWFYAGIGALALEVAVWGPRVDTDSDVVAQDARFQPGQAPRRALGSRPEPSELDRAWAAWLDNTRGGLGFVDWHPVDLGGGPPALVGGWEPRTLDNPPAERLGHTLAGLADFVSGLAAGLPRLELRVMRAERSGDVVELRARAKNLGALPTGLAGGAGPQGSGALLLELALPAGASLIAGEAKVGLGRLEGGELSPEVAWIVLAPEGAVLELSCESELAAAVRAEVRP